MNTLARIFIEVSILLAVYLLGELISHYFIFRILNRRFMKKEPGAQDPQSLPNETDQPSRAQEKGHFERGMLSLGLAAGFPQILIVFGALKIGTFFKGENNDKISSDYYLIGNVVSISVAIIYVVIWKTTVNAIEWN